MCLYISGTLRLRAGLGWSSPTEMCTVSVFLLLLEQQSCSVRQVQQNLRRQSACGRFVDGGCLFKVALLDHVSYITDSRGHKKRGPPPTYTPPPPYASPPTENRGRGGGRGRWVTEVYGNNLTDALV